MTDQLIANTPLTLAGLHCALMHADERCCLEALKLADVLIVTICEGR